MLAHILDVFQAVAVHLLGKVSHHLGQLFIPAPLYNNIVKRNVGFRYLYCVLGPGDLCKPVAGLSERTDFFLSLIHISEPTRLGMISYAVFCLKKKQKTYTVFCLKKKCLKKKKRQILYTQLKL